MMKIDDKYFLCTSKLALHLRLKINSGCQQTNKQTKNPEDFVLSFYLEDWFIFICVGWQ